MNPFAVIGLLLTATWVTLSGLYASILGWETLLAIDPNALGDTMAGFFAPLALLWIIIGFFQQGKELRLQRDELNLQREELALQRAETNRLADEAGRQAKAVESNEQHARRDTFFRLADLTMAELDAIAKKIVRYLADSSFQKIMSNRLAHGERGAFFEGAQEFFRPSDALNSIGRIQVHSDGMKLLERYCEKFERIIIEGESCDPDGYLRKHFMSTSAGELYRLLASALGRSVV